MTNIIFKNTVLFIVGFLFTIAMFWLGGYDFTQRNIETTTIFMLAILFGWGAIELWKDLVEKKL